MSQDKTQDRVSGYVVGSNKDGQEWVVRQQTEPWMYSEVKLRVSSVHLGTTLRPGLDVSFLRIKDGAVTVAADVMAIPPAEDKPKTERPISEDVASIGIMVVRHDGKYSLTFTGARSLQEAQKDLDDLGAENETVVNVIIMPAGEGTEFLSDEAAISALEALIQINEENEDSLCQTLERLLTKVFLAGVQIGRNQK